METKTLLALGMAMALLAGCKKQEDAAPATPEPAAAAASTPAAAPAVQATDEAPTAAAPPARFDIALLPASNAALPDWPHAVPPSGYVFGNADNVAKRTKDLARIPVWTGSQLLWVEGKVFTDRIDNADDKTFSKFELVKGLRQQIETLGGVRVSERSFDRNTYKANERQLDDFRGEFRSVREAYWYDKDVDTYAIRRADGVIWIVLEARNDAASIMVVEAAAD